MYVVLICNIPARRRTWDLHALMNGLVNGDLYRVLTMLKYVNKKSRLEWVSDMVYFKYKCLHNPKTTAYVAIMHTASSSTGVLQGKLVQPLEEITNQCRFL